MHLGWQVPSGRSGRRVVHAASLLGVHPDALWAVLSERKMSRRLSHGGATGGGATGGGATGGSPQGESGVEAFVIPLDATERR